MLNFVLLPRKNGTKFIKIITYSREHNAWVEVGRINLSKQEWVQNNFSIEEIYELLKDDSTVFIYDRWHNYYECKKCELAWHFEGGGPKENNMNYCPKCGRFIKKVKWRG